MLEGCTLRQHLEKEWQQSGECPQELLDAPQLPHLAAHVWEWFRELSAERNQGLNGPERLRYREIDDWEKAFGIRIETWELKALRLIDNAWIQGGKKE